MDVTWKMRNDVYWHDGHQLTADDFIFGWKVALDNKLAVVPVGDLVKITDMKKIDDFSFVAHWKSTSMWANANEREGIPAVPKHILGDLYDSKDYIAMDNSPWSNSEFIGLGPFKLVAFNVGTYWEAAEIGRAHV